MTKKKLGLPKVSVVSRKQEACIGGGVLSRFMFKYMSKPRLSDSLMYRTHIFIFIVVKWLIVGLLVC